LAFSTYSPISLQRPTGDLEWYDPGALITKGGSLEIIMTQEEIHNLSYKSGHLSSWNKFCFTGGYIEGTHAK
jgi:beta-glucanase (GH16 family)